MKPFEYRSFIFVFISAFITPLSVQAGNGTVCVICNEPAKVYQCNFGTGDNLSSLAGLNTKGLQFSCIQEIADYGGHGQCAAARRSEQNCNGEPYQLKSSPPGLNDADGDDTYQENAENYGPETSEQPDTEIKEEKSTLVDATKNTYKNTASGIKKGYNKTTETVEKGYKKTTSAVKNTVKSIGSTIGDAASGTYDCVVSLFSDC